MSDVAEAVERLKALLPRAHAADIVPRRITNWDRLAIKSVLDALATARTTLMDMSEECLNQTAECSRLRAALSFYADRYRYLHDDGHCPPICSDEGEVARAAGGVVGTVWWQNLTYPDKLKSLDACRARQWKEHRKVIVIPLADGGGA